MKHRPSEPRIWVWVVGLSTWGGGGEGSMGAPQAQCARSATIWACGRTRDPYFEILGAPRGIMVTPSVRFDF